jgi:Zn-dependent M28 family amino/carboxypeptidase
MRIKMVFMAASMVAALIAATITLAVQPFVTPLPFTPPQVDSARLQAHVKRLSVDFYPRSFEQSGNIERAAGYILDEFKAAGAVVTVQDVTVLGKTYKNIIASFGPKAGPLLVIGAHYDSHGDTSAETPPGYTPDSHTPGADDNASGVAGLIELAHLLGGKPPSQAIELVAYTLEEPPHFRTEHMGSAWHARSLKAAQRDVRLMLSLEMIGYFSDAPGSQAYSIAGMQHLYSDRGDFVALVGKLGNFGAMRQSKALMSGATDLPVYSINAPQLLQGIDFSDHQSYWNEDIPALMVTDTAFMRNKNYHLAGDTYEKLDYHRMAKVVQAVYALTRQY